MSDWHAIRLPSPLISYEMKPFGLTETKLFHFLWIFKNGGGGVFQTNRPPYPIWIRYCTVPYAYTNITSLKTNEEINHISSMVKESPNCI